MTGLMTDSSEKTPHERAFAALGGAPGIKRAFGISLQAAHKWARQIPVGRARKVESLTGVAAAELHPELFATEPATEAAGG